MVCDGGSIPTRADLVKEKQKEEKPDAHIQVIIKWFYCTLSKKPLEPPVVADLAGKLYNREAIIEFLLDKTCYGDGDLVCPHINSMKDVVTLNLTLNSAKNPTAISSTPESLDEHQLPTSAFMCPITMKEMVGTSLCFHEAVVVL